MACTREPSSKPWGGSARVRAVLFPLLVLLYSGTVLALVVAGAPAVVRAVPVLIYIAVVPGLACVRLVRQPDHFTAFLLAVGLSLALATVVAMVMIYLHRWSPTLGISALAAIASMAAATELFQRLSPRLPSLRRLSLRRPSLRRPSLRRFLGGRSA